MESFSSNQDADSGPGPSGMGRILGVPRSTTAGEDGTVHRRLEWVAVILFAVNFLIMIYASSMYYNSEAWARAAIAVATATAVILLASILLSVFGKTSLAKIALAIGILGLMISVVSLGLRLIQAQGGHGFY